MTYRDFLLATIGETEERIALLRRYLAEDDCTQGERTAYEAGLIACEHYIAEKRVYLAALDVAEGDTQ